MEIAGILNPYDHKRALAVILDSAMRESLAAGLSPRRMMNPGVSLEDCLAHFRRRYDSDYTHMMAVHDFLHCVQGDTPLEEWFEKLVRLAAKAEFGPALDRLLLCQLLSGVADVRCREELIRQDYRHPYDAMQFIRRFTRSRSDSMYYRGQR